jgi:hypothetical protein
MQFVGLAGDIVLSFVWIIGSRGKPRPVRVIGVGVLVGTWLALRLTGAV